MRTQEEIITRMHDADDFLGFKQDVLVQGLTFQTVKPMLADDADVDEQRWNAEANFLDDVTGWAEAKRYMEFAWGKARDHRGISASRSVEKLTEMFWLLGRDDVVAAMEEADYAQYGCPVLTAACTTLGGIQDGWGRPEGEDLARMSEGLPCTPDCEQGCAT